MKLNDTMSAKKIILISVMIIVHDPEDRAVGPDCDCVAFKGLVDMVKDDLHAQQILIVWDAKWCLIMAKHL